MTSRRKHRVLLVSGFAIVSIVLLAAGLSDIEFRPERSLPHRGEVAKVQEPTFRALPSREMPGLIFLIICLVAILLLPFAIVQLVRSPELRKTLRRDLVMLFWLLAVWLIFNAPTELLEEPPMQPRTGPLGETNILPAIESAVEVTTSAPEWAILLTAVALAALVTAVLFGTAWLLWRRRRPAASALEELAHEAQDALTALESGMDVKDTVMRCYFEMSRILGERRGLRRAAATTPREFERQLRQAGLPETHVERLTRLFEGVRYGARVANEQEKRQALDCLTAIVEVCKGSS